MSTLLALGLLAAAREAPLADTRQTQRYTKSFGEDGD
jgi:hypothetical protein